MHRHAKRDNAGNESLLSVNHFVHMYVLPNMLYSHFDCILFNRAKAIFYGEPFTEPLRSHVFHVTDYSLKIDKVLKELIFRLRGKRFTYESVLRNLPAVFSDDQQEHNLSLDIAKTRQVWWALFLSKLKTIKFLIDLGGEKGITANNFHIHKLRTIVKRLLEENVYGTVLNEDDHYDVENTLIELYNL